MQLHLFGATTPTGEAFRQLVGSRWPLHAYSRRRADLTDPATFQPAGDPEQPGVWISFAPIWLLAPFLAHQQGHHPERLTVLRGLVACSSSSALTKRFATNRFDRSLVAQLSGAENQLLTSCHRLGVPCRILQPSLIYGQVGPYGDRNLSRLLQLLRRLPLLPLPADTGLRQPIHARQLAAVALQLALEPSRGPAEPIPVGGDVQLSYTAMLEALQRAQPPGDPAHRCRLLPIPNRLFFLLAAPLLLRSPKAFEAVLRMGADLAGFTPAHQLLDQAAEPFPLATAP